MRVLATVSLLLLLALPAYGQFASTTFDGNDRVNVGDVTTVDNLAAITFAGWVKWDAFTASDRVFNKFAGGPNEQFWIGNYFSAPYTRLNVVLKDDNGDNDNTSSTSALWVADTWTFFATTWTPHTNIVYDASGAVADTEVGNRLADDTGEGLDELDFMPTVDGEAAYLSIHPSALSAAAVADMVFCGEPLTGTAIGIWPLWGDGVDLSVSGTDGAYAGDAAGHADGPPIMLCG